MSMTFQADNIYGLLNFYPFFLESVEIVGKKNTWRNMSEIMQNNFNCGKET